MTTIELKNLTFAYPHQKTDALFALTTTINPGISGVIGGNGAGKTTLFKVLSHHVYLNDPTQLDLPKGSSVLLLPEETHLPEFLTPKELLSATPGVRYHNNSILQTLDIYNYENKLIRECSLGMQKRVTLALALLKQTDILVLDEPFMGIDVDTLLAIKNLLKQRIEDGQHKIILIASHQLDFLQELCDSIFILHRGKLLKNEPPNKLLSITQSGSLFKAYQTLIHPQQ